MLAEYLSVDVAMERIPLVNRWATEKWQPASVVPADGERGGAPVLEADGPAGTRWRFPGVAIELHPSEAEGYFLNLTSDAPGRVRDVAVRRRRQGSRRRARKS